MEKKKFFWLLKCSSHHEKNKIKITERFFKELIFNGIAVKTPFWRVYCILDSCFFFLATNKNGWYMLLILFLNKNMFDYYRIKPWNSMFKVNHFFHDRIQPVLCNLGGLGDSWVSQWLRHVAIWRRLSC